MVSGLLYHFPALIFFPVIKAIWFSCSIYKLYYKRGESIDFDTNSGCNISELQDNNNEGNFQDNESGSLHQFSGAQKQSRFKR